VRFTEEDNVVQALRSDRADESFNVGILPGSSIVLSFCVTAGMAASAAVEGFLSVATWKTLLASSFYSFESKRSLGRQW